MQDPLGYYVSDSDTVYWLYGSPGAYVWSSNFQSAKEFKSLDEANDAMEEVGGGCVFACMPSR